MKQLLILFALAAVSSASVWKGGLRIKFDMGVPLSFGRSFFFEVPRSHYAAMHESWNAKDKPEGLPAPLNQLDMFCYEDNVVCAFYTPIGDIAGLQIALSKEDFTPHFDNMEDAGFTTWTVDGEEFWTIHQFFVTEEMIASQSSSPVRADNENKIIENGGVWVVGTHKEVVKISNSTDEIANEGVFTRQACIPWMGRHYYYKMTPSLSCTDEPLFPWFPIVESGELIATGFVVPGKLVHHRRERNWFEEPNRTAVVAIVPEGPECLYSLASNPGLVTMHIYYVDQPWLVSCIFQ